ncbi:MAG TPA: hypothetical protein PK715_14890, partial [Chitinophagales bacterium]|nr:hypothetical protein [Chitinophagales bacterium]
LSEPDKQLFIEKWLENGGNNPFAKTLKLRQTIDLLLENDPVTTARLMLRQQQTNRATTPETLHQNQPAQATYTDAELRQMFAPLPEMEQALATRSAAGNSLQSRVLIPLSGINCTNSLFFALDHAINTPITCAITGNQGKQLLAHNIPAQQTSFEVPLSLPPGRYYWKLYLTDSKQRKQMSHAIGMFLVNADLMEP